MLFKRPLIQGSRNLLGGKDRKRLKSLIVERFQCKEGEVDETLLPKNQDVTLLSLRGSKIQIYFSQGEPLFFDVENGELYPTLYALIKLPTLVPAFIIHSQVSEFIMKGADLMVPGILEASREAAISKKLSMGISVKGNEIPFAIGKCLISDLRGGKGKALEVYHLFGDHLWELGSRVAPNGGFTLKRIFPSNHVPSEVDQADDAETEQQQQLAGALTSCQITDAEDQSIIRQDQTDDGQNEQHLEQSLQSASCTSQLPTDAAHEPATSEAHSDREEAAEQMEAAATTGEIINSQSDSVKATSIPPPAAGALPTAVIDAFLELCLLETLHTDITDSVTPIATSAVFSKMMGHAGAVQFSKAFEDRVRQINVVPAEHFDRSLVVCDVKKSSHKKLSKFFQHYAKIKLLQAKEIRGDLILISINRESKIYKTYSVVSKTDRKYALRTLGAQPSTASCQDVGSASQQSQASKKTATGFEVLEFYQPDQHSSAIFEAAQIQPSIAEKYFDAAQCRSALMLYVEKKLPRLKDSVEVNDVVLQRCVLSKMERSDAVKDSSSAPVVMTIKDLQAAFMSRLDAYYAVVKASESKQTASSNLVIRRGKLKPVVVQTKVRAGTKAVTMIGDLSPFGIDEKSLAETLQKTLAASATTFELTGAAKGSRKPLGVSVQGRFENEVCEILINEYGIPKQFVIIQ